jgi:glycosyltransferase involved in cell wall biosynthesis
MIARNEEKNIAKALGLLRPHFAEIVVVDTGSSDQTLALASEHADKVLSFAWGDDFSAARNFSLTQAVNDWVLVVDCDEFLEEIDAGEMGRMINSYPEGIGMIIRHNPYESDAEGAERRGALATERVGRLFDRRIHHYQGIIHEQVVRCDGTEPQYFPIPLSFRHEGYLTKKTAEEKARRNLALLLYDLESNGANPYTYFQLGQS